MPSHLDPETVPAATNVAWTTETQRKLRGHNFYPSSLATWPPLYSTDGQNLADISFVAHYFVAGANWYVAELDQADGLAFGYADLGLGGGEYGYMSLPELEETAVRPSGFPQTIERDLDFVPGTKASSVLDQYRSSPPQRTAHA